MIKEMVDIILRNKYGGFVAVVEIWNPKNLTREWAIDSNLQQTEYIKLTRPSYYLLVSQDVAFVWRNPYIGQANNEPIAELQMWEVLRRYLPETSLVEERLGKNQLDFLVFQWLSDLARGFYKEPLQASERTLDAIGFLEEIQSADIEFDV